MSYTFALNISKTPPFGPLLQKLNYPDLRCSELSDDESGGPAFVATFPSQAWPPGILHLFREKVSTRGIEVENSTTEMSVRFMTLCSEDDFELGFKVLELLAACGDGIIRPEDGEPFPVQELRQQFGSDWVRGQNESGMRAGMALAKKGDDVTIPGAIRNFYLGPRILQELQAAPDAMRLKLLLDKLRGVQFPGDEWFTASVMEVKPKGASPAFTCSAFAPNVDYLFGPVDFLMLDTGSEDDYLFLPYEHLDNVAGEHSIALDDKNRLVRKFSTQEWSAFLSRAEPFRKYPAGAMGAPKEKKWWQFWN